ncbi:MAG: WbqC family protein [Patescibacteria group bacterium]|jgi:hypothetical protein
MQPTYLPWLGYFELMLSSDVFVYFDDVQFVSKSWQQRNRIKTATGELMLTVPVLKKGEHEQVINQTLINNQENWRRKHLGSIENSYRKAPYFDHYIDGIREIYARDFTKLIDLNVALNEFVRAKVGITTPVKYSSQICPPAERNARIVDICHKIGATELYDAAGAEAILDLDYYKKNNVKMIFQHYNHPIYKQQFGEFLPYMSAIDLLFNEGEKAKEIIISGGIND